MTIRAVVRCVRCRVALAPAQEFTGAGALQITNLDTDGPCIAADDGAYAANHPALRVEYEYEANGPFSGMIWGGE